MASQDGTTSPSAMEKLPLELRRQIYHELLKAENVRQPPNKHLVRDYRFETAILRVNKRLHGEAYDVLYGGNTFVVVSCNWAMITTILTEHQVATLARSSPKLVANFKVL